MNPTNPTTAEFFEKLTSPSAKLVDLSQSLPIFSSRSAILIFPSTIIIALLISYILNHWLKRWSQKTSTPLDDVVVAAIDRPIFWTLIAFGLILSLSSLNIFSSSIPIITKILLTFILTIWTRAIIKVSITITDIIQHQAHKQGHGMEKSMLIFLQTVLRITLYAFSFLLVLGVWGVNIAPILASAGILAAALSLGAKDAVANFIGGISVLTDKPFVLGDTVQIQNTHSGKVIDIGLRSTKIQTFDRKLITVPNSIMAGDVVINKTGIEPTARISLKIGVAYDSDLNKVETTLMKLLTDHPDVLDSPAPFIRFQSFADSAIELKAYAYVGSSGLKGKVKHDLVKSIQQQFAKQKIEIPYPQRTIHQASAK
jgi:MscS family membrane protein